MIISYYVFDKSEDEGLLIFQSLHEDVFLKDFYNQTKNEKLETNLYFLSDSILPFLANDKVFNRLKTTDIKNLPIIEIDGEIVKTGGYLSIEELAELAEIGMSIQRRD